MKITLAQQNYRIGDFEGNTSKIKKAIETARQEGSDLIVFSELCVCGYPPRDFLEFHDFIEQCQASVQTIADASVGIAVIVGAPQVNPNKAGKDLFNAAYFIADGRIQSVVQKTCLPTYDVFDEYRYFEPASSWQVINYKNHRIALTICEDIWNVGENPMYPVSPMDVLHQQQPTILINISASPFDYTHPEDRLWVLSEQVRKYQLPVIYCNAVGSQTELVFDGQSMVVDGRGDLRCRLSSFEEAYVQVEVQTDGRITDCPVLLSRDLMPVTPCEPVAFDPKRNIEQVYQALISGIRDYFSKMGFQKAILGSSGGIDSAVTLALAVDALGAEQVLAVLMPSPFSSEHSITDAVELSKRLKTGYHIIPITEVNRQLLETLDPYFTGQPPGLAEENIQSRIRGNILMALANKKGYILLNTSNKSELATGYGTLYGDMAGGLSVLGDCYKEQVYALARYINRNEERIPINILQKEPSAELRPDQRDSDTLPDYPTLDALLYQYIERRQGPREIKTQGFDSVLTDRVLGMVNRNEYKRNQFCPIIRISSKAFGIGRRLPIVAHYLQ